MSNEIAPPPPGTEPGLRFALLRTPDGAVQSLSWAGVHAWRPADGFLWIHLERDDEIAQQWLSQDAHLPSLVVRALMDEDSRPRVEDIGDDLLIVLRGVNIAGRDAEDEAGPELIPLHIWMEAGRCITLRDKAHALSALRELRLSLLAGKGPRTASGLLALIAESVLDRVFDLIDELDTAVATLEDEMADGDPGEVDIRGEISTIRRRAAQVRRYLAPQRDTLYKIRHDDAVWLDNECKDRLREINERLTRHLEDIDEIRHRAMIVNEDFATAVAQRSTQAANRLTVLAALILPPSLVTSLLGVNLAGIPGADHPWAFLWLLLIVVVMVPGTWLALRLFRWL